MSDDEESIDPTSLLGFDPIEPAEYESPDDVEVDEDNSDGIIEIPVFCPDCSESMSVNTVVSQADVNRNGRARYEAVCTDCQTATILTVMKTVGDYNDLFGFESMEMDWEVEDLGDES